MFPAKRQRGEAGTPSHRVAAAGRAGFSFVTLSPSLAQGLIFNRAVSPVSEACPETYMTSCMCVKYPVQSCVQEIAPLVAGTAVSTEIPLSLFLVTSLEHRPPAPAVRFISLSRAGPQLRPPTVQFLCQSPLIELEAGVRPPPLALGLQTALTLCPSL